MAISQEYKDHVFELFAELGPVEVKRMFGGLGVFYRGVMFCLVANGEFFFKVGPDNMSDFKDIGSVPFSFVRKSSGRQMLTSYYRLPDDLLEDDDARLGWARGAVDAALTAAREKSEKQKRKKTVRRTASKSGGSV